MATSESSRELLTIEEYITLSAKINYQLSAHRLNKPALLALVLGPTDLPDHEQALLLETFAVLQMGYHEGRRRLGTPGILHPLRAAAMLTRSLSQPSFLHLAGALLHDKEEDLTEGELGAERWQSMQRSYEQLLGQLGAEQADLLQRCVTTLAIRATDTYELYLGRILDQAPTMPQVLHIKLADRIDNTFDIHLQHPGVTKYNFYRAVFDILFLPRFGGVDMGRFHFMPKAPEGVMLLSQLFKDLIFLSLLRGEQLDTLDDTTHRLFIGLAVAGIREAQWLAMEMFNTCITDVGRQRVLLRDVMAYCADGGIEAVTRKEVGGELDGMLLGLLAARQEGKRNQMLTRLFEDHELLARMVLAFIVVFAAFINDPAYYIRGVDRTGIRATS